MALPVVRVRTGVSRNVGCVNFETAEGLEKSLGTHWLKKSLAIKLKRQKGKTVGKRCENALGKKSP